MTEQKKAGRIRHLGFSAHGSLEVMKRFLDACGAAMEFCQIQLNYLDWTFQDAKAKVELLNSHNIPIWVMEPLRAGRLAKLPAESENALQALRPDESIPAWAFRFLQGVPGVTVILSGMSNLEQLQENIRTFETDRPLNGPEKEVLRTGGGFIAPMALMAVPAEKQPSSCIGCRSCERVCPQQIRISEAMSAFAHQLNA